AGRVMAEEGRAQPELGAEFGFLVRPHAQIAVADRDIAVARQEYAAVGQALQRRKAAQRVIVREGVVEERRLERQQIEALGEVPRLVRRQLDQSGCQSCASSSANTVWPAALIGPTCASAGGRITSA